MPLNLDDVDITAVDIDPLELEMFVNEKLDPACDGQKVPVAVAGMLIKCATGLNPNLNETQLAQIFVSVSEHLAMQIATVGASQTIH